MSLKEFTRQEKLRISNNIIQSEEWEMLSAEYEKEARRIEAMISSKLHSENTNGVFLNEGIKLGIYFCLNLPRKLRDDNRNYFDKLYHKIVGEEQISANGGKQ